MKKNFLIIAFTVIAKLSFAQSVISTIAANTNFCIADQNTKTVIYVDSNENSLVIKAASFLQSDIEKVTGKTIPIIHSIPETSFETIIIIGTTQNSSAIKNIISDKKITTDKINGRWEAYQIQTLSDPYKNIKHALVIAGNDRRGTAFGVFEISRQMGVSPWYWWADVPVKKAASIFINKNTLLIDSPLVKYRGIFINDEAPCLSGWTKEKFGMLNHHFYEKVFELLLRLKANYLWPAMWNNAFNADDTLNPVMADEYGIVMSTSHHEPMLRSQQEWKRFGKGKWDYTVNDSVLKAFWRKGIEHMGNHESLVTIGMRGDGDEPMMEGTAIDLLENIVKEQRQIIEDVTKKPASETPQVWALYKEVQDYYDKGMRVPDDVTLLLCDDNWGNIRKLPKLNEAPRKGGYGIYYHFDYVGSPRNYKWINTNNIARIWEQMHLAYEYKVDKIWIVNVGDIKPMEYPISFFLEDAWNPEKYTPATLQQFQTQWAAQQFGDKYASQIGYLLNKYSVYNARRKPELLSADTYSIENYNEAKRVVDDYGKLVTDAKKIDGQIAPQYKDAFYQLVLYPIMASANLNAMYYDVAENKYYAGKEDIRANAFADEAKRLFKKDKELSNYYNDTLANGKWQHMMDQTHIGYTSWQQPDHDVMPDVEYVTTPKKQMPEIKTLDQKAVYPKDHSKNSFYEWNKYVSINAEHFTKKIDANGIAWKVIPGIGKDGAGVTTFPVTADAQILTRNGPHLEYEIYTSSAGDIKLQCYFSPTLYFNNTGLRYAISIDDEAPQIINMHEDKSDAAWRKWVADNIIIKTTQHHLSNAGKHIVKFWMIDPAVVLQKIMLDLGGLRSSYLGAPETRIKN